MTILNYQPGFPYKMKKKTENIDPISEDDVKSPSHYNHLDAFCKCGEKYQPYKLTQELPFNKGSAIKYLIRSGHKNDEIQDLMKAQQFIDFEIERVENKQKSILAVRVG